MIGYSGTYAINSTRFVMLPTKASWQQREELGMDGNGHPIYPAVREFRIEWNLMHPTDAQQIKDAYNVVQNTGTVAFDLPDYTNPNYVFKCYSGCTIAEPEFDEYFMGYIINGKLTIYNVRT